MKKLLLLALAFVLIVGIYADVVIGTGTSIQRQPFGSYWGFERSASLYTAGEINATGTITHLEWYVGRDDDTIIPAKIYLTTTPNTTMTATAWDDMISGLTPVFDGDLQFNTPGWHQIDITDFPYNHQSSGNLLVICETNYGGGGSGYSTHPQFHYTTSSTTTGRHQYWNVDTNPPTTQTGNVNSLLPNITLVGITDTNPPSPTMALSPADGVILVNPAATLNWNSLMNATGYKLYFGSTNPPAYIGDLGDVTTYNPNGMADETTYYWQVVPYNTYGEATGCPVWSFETLPAGIVMIGDGTSNQYMPVNTFYGYSYAQSIYLQQDINVADQRIEKISYYWNGVGAAPNSNEWVVYMGHTDEETFASTSDWVPVNELTPVYSGTLNIPATEGWITINLTNPFIYNNSQNLVIAVDENKPSYDGSSYFFFNTLTTDENRSLRYQSDSTNPDPASPPVGTLTAAFPNILMEFGDLPANPIFSYSPTALDFGTLLQDTSSDWQNVIVTNTGAGTINLSANDISIFGTNATMFDFDDVNLPAAIGPGISVNIPVRATATDEGVLSATLRIVYNANDYDVALSVFGLPDGTLIVGEGTATSRFPLGGFYGYECSAALYTAAELGAGNKRINTLGWYATGEVDVAIPTKIYLASYAANTIAVDNWQNLIENATPVFDATISTINADDWHLITLANTFDLDSGENLLVLVERNFGGTGSGIGSIVPAILGTTMNNVHLTWQRDNEPPIADGSTASIRPNLLVLATSYTITNPPNPAIAASPADEAEEVDVTATLNWISGGGAPDGYKLYFGDSTPPAYIGDMGDALSYNPTLAYSSTYYWQVIPYNSNGEAANCPIWSFETKADPTVMLPVTFDFTGEAAGALPTGWDRSHANWSLVATANAGGSAPELRMYWNPSTDDIVRAITPPLYGDNEDGYILKFKHMVDHYSYGDPYTLKVEVSTDKANWTTLWSMVPTAIETTEVLVPNDLSAYLETPFYLAWTFDGNTYDINNWYVDDISITAIISGSPAIPTLTFPADAAINLPKDGFNLTWEPDLNNGGMPDYYAVFMSQDEETIYDDHYFEVDNPFFNPVTDSEGEIVFAYEDRWYWTVLAANNDGESDPAEMRSFQIEADPAITSFPWCEGFEGSTFPPAGWTMVDADGDGYNWFQYSYSPHTGNYSAATASWVDGVTLYPDNWLITPPIAVPATGDYMVEYYVAGQDPDYPEEHYGFYVSTSGPAIANFTLLREETLEDAEWHQRTNPLASYAGQTVHFAFRHFNVSDVFYMKIDDVCVREIPQAPELSINPTEFHFGTTHTFTPTTPKTFTLSNIGLDTIDIGVGDIWLTGDVEGNFVLDTQDLPVEISSTEPYNFTVQFIAQSAGFKSATLNVQDNITRAVHTVALTGEAVEEPIANVIMLEGELYGADAARLDWLSIYGDPTQSGYLHWDDSIDRGAVGAGGNQYHVAVMFGPEVMENTVGQVLDGVMIHINEQPQTLDYLKVWSGTGADIAPETLLTTEAVSGLTVGWNYIPLTSPIPTTNIDALWVGYHVNGIEDTFPASTDGLSPVNGRGNLVELGGDWMTLVNAGIDGNWLIHAHFTEEAEYLMTRRPATLTAKTTHAQVMNKKEKRRLPLAAIQTVEMDRALRGFNIFRDNVQINTEVVPAYFYTDENLAPGTYHYAVQSVHDSTNGPISYTVPVTIPEPPTPFALPFTEEWDNGMEENMWMVDGANWQIDDDFGYPAPSVIYDWSPGQENYEHFLTSYNLDATGIDNVYLGFNLHIRSYDDFTDNYMFWEVWDGTEWVTLGGYNAAMGDLNWATVHIDISEYVANRIFKIRFVATGEDTYSIWEWGIDNIKVAELPTTVDPITDLSVETTETGDFLLSWTENPDADWYMIYVSDDPYADYVELGFIDAITGTLELPAYMLGEDKQFLKMTVGVGPLPESRNLLENLVK